MWVLAFRIRQHGHFEHRAFPGEVLLADVTLDEIMAN
jgi:hypothetical protein